MHPGRRTLFSAHTAAVAEVAPVEPVTVQTPEKVPQRSLSKEVAKEQGHHSTAPINNATNSTEGQRPLHGLATSSNTPSISTYHERSISLLLQSVQYPALAVPHTVVLLLIGGGAKSVEGSGAERKGVTAKDVKSVFERAGSYLRHSANDGGAATKPSTSTGRYVTISDSVSSTLERRLLQLKEEFTESDEQRRMKLLEANKEKPAVGQGTPPSDVEESQGPRNPQLSIVLVEDELNHRASHRAQYLSVCTANRGNPNVAVTVGCVVEDSLLENIGSSTPSDPNKRKRGRTEEEQPVELPTLEEGFDLICRFG